MNAANGTALVPVNITPAPLAKTSADSQAFEPRNINDAMRLAELLVASRMLPRTVQTPEAAFAIIATGRELGLSAMQSLRTIHVIEGKPTLSADLILAMVKSRRDICSYFMLVESTPTQATYRTQRFGEPEPTTMSFSMDDAQRAGVASKDNWRKFPAAMLRARCITALARAVYPDLAMGIYDEEELEPSPPQEMRQVTVQAVPAPPPRSADTGEAVHSVLQDRAFAAETPAALNAIARDATRAHKAGEITDEQLGFVAGTVKHRRALLAAGPAEPAPEPPTREPGEEG